MSRNGHGCTEGCNSWMKGWNFPCSSLTAHYLSSVQSGLKMGNCVHGVVGSALHEFVWRFDGVVHYVCSQRCLTHNMVSYSIIDVHWPITTCICFILLCLFYGKKTPLIIGIESFLCVMYVVCSVTCITPAADGILKMMFSLYSSWK